MAMSKESVADDMEFDHQEEARKSERTKILTEKGSDYEKELKLRHLNSARRKTHLLLNTLEITLQDTESTAVIKKEISYWKEAYENFIACRDRFSLLLSDTEREVLEKEMEFDNRQFVEFIDSLRNIVVEAELEVKADDGASVVSGVSRRSSQASLNIIKVKAGQERADIFAHLAALKEKHELEAAKRLISQKEEELELKTKLSIAKAKEKVSE